jgi:hypothetical protein
MNDLVRADSCSTRHDANVFLPRYGLGSGAEMLKPLAIPLTRASTLSAVLSLNALIWQGYVPHTSKKNDYRGRRTADEERMRVGTESQAREVPPSRLLAKGECVLGKVNPNVAKTIRSLPPIDWTVAGADTLVAVRIRSGCLCRVLQCRLEIPRVAVLIERQAHHAPEFPGCRLDILCVEVRVAARIGGCCVGCDHRIECLAPGAHNEFPYTLLRIVFPGGVKGAITGIEVVVSVQHQVGSVLVKQFPKGLSGRAFRYGDAVRSAERGLVPVGECASRMIGG